MAGQLGDAPVFGNGPHAQRHALRPPCSHHHPADRRWLVAAGTAPNNGRCVRGPVGGARWRGEVAPLERQHPLRRAAHMRLFCGRCGAGFDRGQGVVALLGQVGHGGLVRGYNRRGGLGLPSRSMP